jgi:preprotein translocase subunit SecA
VLIDEARMPLILSERAANNEQSAFYRQALFLAAQLKFGEDFELDHAHRRATLTGAGRQRAETLASRMGGAWTARRRREETLCQALAARHLFLNHRHYLVRDDEVVIIDETTGRAAPGRIWSQGLHQMIELKENCASTDQQQTVAQTTFQRFFSHYLRLSGISGTLLEAKGELLAIYGLPVASIPLQFPCRRQRFPDRVFADRDARWRHVVERVLLLRECGRPVLIGTDSVGESEALSTLLTQAGVPHAVLNARFDAEEAQIVAQAGQIGAVTVSTNMAGRGTDIRLGAGVAALGGMHVIACQTNDTTRIDRQLHGRCARQGEPGSVEHLHCLDDGFEPLSTQFTLLTRCLRISAQRRELPAWLSRLARLAQKMRSRHRQREQWLLFLRDKQMDRHLAFAGPHE